MVDGLLPLRMGRHPGAVPGVRCLILRGVSDLVDCESGDAYGGHVQAYAEGARAITHELFEYLPEWLRAAR